MLLHNLIASESELILCQSLQRENMACLKPLQQVHISVLVCLCVCVFVCNYCVTKAEIVSKRD